MSFVRRWIRNYRQDITAILPDIEAGSRNAPPTFRSSLILQSVTDPNNLDHLAIVANKTPLGRYITAGMANEALGDHFVLVDADGNEIMQDTLKEMELLRAKDVMIQALTYERTYGYSYVYTGKNRYVPQTPEGGRLASLHAFTPVECVVKRYSDIGEPVQMEVTVHKGVSDYTTMEEKILLPADDFIFVNTRPIGRGYQGWSALAPVWDYLTYLLYTFDSMCWTDMKWGAGLFAVMTKASIPDTLVRKLNASLEDMGNRRAWVADGSKIDDVKFVGPSVAAGNFPSHIDYILMMIGAGTWQSKDVFLSTTSSATSSQVSQKSTFKVMSEIQGDVEKYYREIITRMGYSDGNGDYWFGWNARYAHDEEEQAKIAMADAQTLAIRAGWLKINEIREIEGLEPMEDGDMRMADINVAITGPTPQEDEQTRRPKGATEQV